MPIAFALLVLAAAPPHHLLLGPDGRLYVADIFNRVIRIER